MSYRIINIAVSFLVLASALAVPTGSYAQLSAPNRVNSSLVSLDQKLDVQVPRDASFFDDEGKPVTIGSYLNNKRPVLLCLIFYKCPGVCVRELEGLVRLFNDKEMSLKPGRDLDVVVVGINPKENATHAASKKREFTDLLRDPSAGKAGWHFLTGSQENIKSVADTVGFRYTADLVTEQFVHPAGIILLTPEGRTSKYFYKSEWSARDVRLALVEASNNRIGSLSDRILVTCVFQFDMKTGRYGVAIVRVMQIGALLTVLILGTSILMMSIKSGKSNLSKATPPDPRAGEQSGIG